MPKQSKIKSARVTSQKKIVVEPDRTYYCVTCGLPYKKRNKNFPMGQSPLWRGNNGYLPTCKNCIDNLFLQYRGQLKSSRDAMKRICMKYDIYWSDSIFDSVKDEDTASTLITKYISRCNIVRNHGLTYDNTVTEDSLKASIQAANAPLDDNTGVSEEVRQFWGAGFDDQKYSELDARYQYWVSQYPKDVELDAGVKGLLRQICILETQINMGAMSGEKIEKSVTALNALFKSANLRPSQQTDTSSAVENMPLGVGIKKWEDTRPLPEVAPEFRDVDGIRKYITTWFFGHIGKMLGIKKLYSKAYEDAIQQLRVEKPEFEEEEDDEAFLDDVLGAIK